MAFLAFDYDQHTVLAYVKLEAHETHIIPHKPLLVRNRGNFSLAIMLATSMVHQSPIHLSRSSPNPVPIPGPPVNTTDPSPPHVSQLPTRSCD